MSRTRASALPSAFLTSVTIASLALVAGCSSDSVTTSQMETVAAFAQGVAPTSADDLAQYDALTTQVAQSATEPLTLCLEARDNSELAHTVAEQLNSVRTLGTADLSALDSLENSDSLQALLDSLDTARLSDLALDGDLGAIVDELLANPNTTALLESGELATVMDSAVVGSLLSNVATMTSEDQHDLLACAEELSADATAPGKNATSLRQEWIESLLTYAEDPEVNLAGQALQECLGADPSVNRAACLEEINTTYGDTLAPLFEQFVQHNSVELVELEQSLSE